ncbi:2-succinyl-5-enolpyruvyl-6-hydroxy-3-cyclohexene-1-carboxylic-acid synthase [Sulfuricystis multivorans]|uniref:2-succinyl-5-enolpyruvyl-6-hydroxy-3- cyclohexene-1-carboxylic-acid synthase n=1 Tax=Sulfuricystis multivorans TaxID=2211108 RepID=UPI000F82AFA2|nr:2-succinyl-5-enolpyruvyl-6-hydroxy-3-cyclohexene-1-carboxylic-acid synthase [Sulfuricystis multivorans]
MNTGTRNLAWADHLIAAFVAAGVHHAVLAPGARSAPLALACLRRPELDCQVINDERAAGFFALGLGKASRRPALVITTSGTAAANLLPAIVEANLASVPLIALTADRPPEMHGWEANQTIDQTKLYGEHVRAFHALPPPDEAIEARFFSALAARLVATATTPLPGPLHVNLPFREPLLPETLPAPPALPAPIVLPAPATQSPENLDAIAARLFGRPGVIICGEASYPDGFAQALAQLADALEAPVIVEALSNLRFGPHDKSRFVAHAARFLRETNLPEPAWVLRFGAFPISRALERWLKSLTAAEHLLVAPPGRWPDPLWQSGSVLRGEPLAIASALISSCRPASAEFPERLGARRDVSISASAEFSTHWLGAEVDARAMTDTRFFEGTIARTLLAQLPAGCQVFVGNSLAIRAVDAFGGLGETPLTLYGNRGASGIDGSIATAAGIAQASGAPSVALIGDQTLLHDATSLALAARHGVTVVLLNNGGGGIFAHLPFASALPPELLRHGWIAPQRCDLAALAAAFGMTHERVHTLEALRAALAPLPRGCLIEASIDPQDSQTCFAH